MNVFTTSSLVGALLYTYLYYSELGEIPNFKNDYLYILIFLLVSNVVGFSIKYSDYLLNKIISWKSNTLLRFLSGMGINTVLTFAVVATGLYFILFTPVFKHYNNDFYFFLSDNYNPVIKLGLLMFFSVFIYSIIDFTQYSYNQYAVVQFQNAKKTSKQLELQFDALKSQLSPHYLFNLLNTVSSLVHESAEKTEVFVRQLVHSYQYILQTNKKTLVTVEEEIAFIKAYKYLLSVRFEEGIKVNINIDEKILKSYIPPLTIQMLLENAVKHNVISDKIPLDVNIYNEAKHIIVTNRLTIPPSDVPSSGVGLSNIKSRYKFFNTKPITISNTENDFTVILPVIEKNDD